MSKPQNPLPGQLMQSKAPSFLPPSRCDCIQFCGGVVVPYEARCSPGFYNYYSYSTDTGTETLTCEAARSVHSREQRVTVRCKANAKAETTTSCNSPCSSCLVRSSGAQLNLWVSELADTERPRRQTPSFAQHAQRQWVPGRRLGRARLEKPA